DTSTQIPTQFSGNNIRGAATDDGSRIWAAGATGVVYAPFGSTLANQQAQLLTLNTRFIGIASEQLYASTAAMMVNHNVFSIGTGLPTTAGQTTTEINVAGTANASPYGFAFFDLIAGGSGPDTLYVCDDSSVANGGGVQRWQLS